MLDAVFEGVVGQFHLEIGIGVQGPGGHVLHLPSGVMTWGGCGLYIIKGVY